MIFFFTYSYQKFHLDRLFLTRCIFFSKAVDLESLQNYYLNVERKQIVKFCSWKIAKQKFTVFVSGISSGQAFLTEYVQVLSKIFPVSGCSFEINMIFRSFWVHSKVKIDQGISWNEPVLEGWILYMTVAHLDRFWTMLPSYDWNCLTSISNNYAWKCFSSLLYRPLRSQPTVAILSLILIFRICIYMYHTRVQ